MTCILRGRGHEDIYTQQKLDAIDRKYYAMIVADQYYVTLMSKNTHYVWQLHNVELPDGDMMVVSINIMLLIHIICIAETGH